MSHTVDFVVHAHFYQPPRENPFAGEILPEPEAAPYANWNERITAECYAPNAAAGNFDRLSFNLGGTLAGWLARRRPEVYARIVEADRRALARAGAGNALAQPVHHTILPLARRRERVLQISWGIASFEHRFGRRPHGVWLPECAVDLEVLECLAEAGLRFTIVSEEQVAGELPDGGHAGAYRVRLPRDRWFAVYVRDHALSNRFAFDLPWLAQMDNPVDWLRGELAARAGHGRRLVLAAVDGETFGHHHREGAALLATLLGAAGNALPYRVTSLGEDWHTHTPRHEVRLVEPSAWSCPHGLARWVTGCACTPGDSRWKGALRRALDNLASELDVLYETEARALGASPWLLLEGYIAVVLQQLDGEHYLRSRGLGDLTSAQSERLLDLLRAEFYRQRMFTSCGFFFEDITRVEPRIVLANAAMAVYLARRATGIDLGAGLAADLRFAVDTGTGVTGADLYEALWLDGTARIKET